MLFDTAGGALTDPTPHPVRHKASSTGEGEHGSIGLILAIALPLLAVLAVAVALVVLHRAPGKVNSPATSATVSTVAAVVVESNQPTGATVVPSHGDDARADEV